MTNVSTAPVSVESKPAAVRDLEEFYDQVVKHNEEIKAQISMVDGFADSIHGVSSPTASDSPPDEQPSGSLGHIRFALTEQSRLLGHLATVSARL